MSVWATEDKLSLPFLHRIAVFQESRSFQGPGQQMRRNGPRNWKGQLQVNQVQNEIGSNCLHESSTYFYPAQDESSTALRKDLK